MLVNIILNFNYEYYLNIIFYYRLICYIFFYIDMKNYVLNDNNGYDFGGL